MDELVGGDWPLYFLIAFTPTISTTGNVSPTILAELNFKGIFKYYQLIEASKTSTS